MAERSLAADVVTKTQPQGEAKAAKTHYRLTILGELGYRKAPEYRTAALLCCVC